MSLSNTATPRYYEDFREKVLTGKIPVCREIESEMNRIEKLIADPAIFYDDEAVESYVRFCENELTLTDGSPMVLLDTFKLWAEQIFGWYYFVERSIFVPDEDYHGGHYERRRIKKRLTRKQYLIIGRGAAKSVYASTLQAFFLVADPSTTRQITTAPTMRLADEVMAPFRTAIVRARGPMFKFMTYGSIQNTTGSKMLRVKLASTKKGIENFVTGSILEVRPMTIDKLQGLQPKLSTIDEWLSGDIREDVVGALQQGAAKLDDWLIVAISSEGTVRNGPGDSIKMELASILKGDYYAPDTSIWWYKLDDIKEVSNPAMWAKAQPNIGKTVKYEDYQKEVARMEAVPSTRNDTLAKRFGIPMEGYTYFFPYEETLPHRERRYWGMSCSMGCDLSKGDDFCAFTFMFPVKDGYGIKTRAYISSRTLDKLPPALREKYDDFMAEGTLIVLNGTTIDMMEVYDDLDAYINHVAYDVVCVGYDPYNADKFIDRWKKENGEYGVEKVIQGKRTESVPLGEIKILSEDRLLLFDEKMMQFAMGNCIVLEDINGNRQLLKRHSDEKIDNVSAMLDAYVALKLHPDDF